MDVDERIDAPFQTSHRTQRPAKDADEIMNKKYREHSIIYHLFFGVLIVTIMEIMFMYGR